MPKFCVILITAITAAFSQAVPDSSAAPARADIVRPEPQTDETAPDSLLAAPDSTAAAPAKEPAFDFRRRPEHFLRALYPDSTAIIGSRYTSFGDIYDWLPGGYHYNRGGAGQLSYGTMFGAPAGEMVLEYDGLILNDPLSGLADFSLIPTESMGHAGILHSADKTYGYMPIGHSLQFDSRTIADNPIRSQVGYRTGFYQYNDIDIRVGIKSSQKFWLDIGGVIRGYGGIRSNEGYSGTIVNAKLHRRFGGNWLLKYVMLFSLRDAELPLPNQIADLPAFQDPKQKDGRIDHALILTHRQNFSTTLQVTQLENELRAANKSVFFAQNKAQILRGTSELSLPLGAAQWRTGLHAWTTRARSNNWDHDAWQIDAYSSLAAPLLPGMKGHISLKAEKHAAFVPQLLPELSLFFAIDSTAAVSAWANRIAHYPGLMARTSGPFARGNLDLSLASYDQIGLAGEKQFDHLFAHVTAAWMRRKNQISTYYDGAGVTYRNMPIHSTLCLSAVLDVHFLRKWRFILKGDAFSDLGAEPTVTQRPRFHAKTFLQYHLLAFQGDLDAELRLGAFFLGRRSAPLPFYADYSVETRTLQPAIYPYLHAVLHYGAADIFFAYENYIDADVQYVYGYSMPQLWFRYGFIWHFID
ncbi:hypothetical protein JW998_06535 [candidate division KSB1 bacterium]|nr:hypothetical protein [candidate division KSB1 bacterium]